MVNINFVPDDYVQNNESRRTNLMYLVLFAVVMIALCGSFMTIKIRQHACGIKEKLVNAKMAKIQESIKQFEELQTKRGEMMRTALTTSELLEPVPRSILLASLTNNLPQGASLLKLNLVQKNSGQLPYKNPTTKYKATQEQKAEEENQTSPEKLLDTNIDIEGMAPSDLQVADYIERLSNSNILDNVALVESKEDKAKDGTTYRHFKLTATLKKEIHLTLDDVKKIKDEAENTMWNF
ncbi:MAG: PilN domain-containing protein [Sedimentisphaerales bacterium]|nr:PilN domain-containing protein [Sedimentisphaerales bacterium]